ncbi:MAG: T9SS type A sorting domain-containing protein [Ignavibacteria bacterium]|nr:T9SS type A sorting domain-containing protein [Ignavibacteria bacterium]
MNSLTGFYATDYAIYRTSNGGSDWDESFNVGNIYPRSVSFVNANTGWVLALTADTSFRNIILRTDNSGVTWGIHELVLPSKRFNKVYFTSSNTGWLLGDSGYIYKTTNGGFPIGIQPISAEIPRDFSLSQNYPNPFNPSTIIRLDISGTSAAKTSLIVYDLLGREVAVLVDENLRPGEYEVHFDGTNYPSGIYYYKLTTGNFSETRKMILLK